MVSLYDSTTTVAEFVFEIPQGGKFHLEFPPMADATTGEPFDFPGDPEGTWIARMEVRTQAGALLTTLATDGSGDGTITLDSAGIIALDLPATVTTDLPATYDVGNPTALERTVVADIKLTDPKDGETYRFFVGKGRILKEVTI